MTDKTTSKTTSKTIGVLGGLGPAATADFFSKVVAATPAAIDQDHLHVIIDNNPKVPNRNEAVAGTGVSPAPVLAEMASRLETAGADFLVMVCNAAHAFQDAITDAVHVPFVSIIEETSDAAKMQVPAGAKVGVLASSGCLDARLYQDALAARGLHALVPEGATKDAFMTLLYRIKAGDDDVRVDMRQLAEHFIDQGAQAIIAGCTEVPLVLSSNDLNVPLINSTDVLVARTIAYATGEADLKTRPQRMVNA
jgi:aspartate racemase